jgi:hypothetical protein
VAIVMHLMAEVPRIKLTGVVKRVFSYWRGVFRSS